jgi:hypothetical protein
MRTTSVGTAWRRASSTWRRAGAAVLALLAMLAVTLTASVATAPGAVAEPCEACEPNPGGPPGPVLHGYKIWADSSNYLAVVETEDNGDRKDEAYIRVNNSTVWGPKSVSPGVPGNAHFYNVSFATTAYAATPSSQFTIELFDDDWPDADDSLGFHRITLPGIQIGQTRNESRTFTEDGANYSMTFKITRVS